MKPTELQQKEDSLIRLEDVCFAYEEEPVLQHISLRMEQGKTYVLWGPNGCGKSTLLRMINGLVFPEQGHFFFRGQEVTRKKMQDTVYAKQFHKQVGFIFQNPEIQLFCASVEEEVAFAPRQMELPETEIQRRTEDCIRLLQLEKLRHRAPVHLSLGEKKKVAIAAILAQNPDILVLDEPISGLDDRSQKWLTEFLLSLRQAGKTIIIATHNRTFAERVADRIFYMNEAHELVG